MNELTAGWNAVLIDNEQEVISRRRDTGSGRSGDSKVASDRIRHYKRKLNVSLVRIESVSRGADADDGNPGD